MRLRVLAIGKLKDERLASLCDEYVKRSQTMMPMERVVCRDVEDQWARSAQAGASTVLLDERGDQISTPALAEWLEDWRDRGVRQVDFLVGDAGGYDDAARTRADRVLGLSMLTMPHRLAQLVLCEQLYRAGTILAGHPYHHE